MARAKTITQAAANLREVAPLIGQRYTAGIQGADWQTTAASDQAEANWGQGVQRAIANGSRRAGILEVSNQSWQQSSINKGAPIIGQRIVDAIDSYTRNFAPILAAMTATQQTLPARTSSAQQNIQNRLIPIVQSAMIAAGRTFT